MQKLAITQAPIDSTIANRWSGRAYDVTRSVSHEQVIALLEAARWAPSCYGDQPWRFVVWNKNTDEASWQKAFDCLAAGNQAWVKDAPILILVCSDTLFSHNQQANRWAQYDTGAAAENLCLQASSMGLMAHQMGGFDSEKTQHAFDVPKQYVPMAMISVGYAADVATLSGDVLARETAERKRKSLGELFFYNVWNNSV
ncbi:MAG: nitroreductase family protein [Methylotenera sp.]|nr:nitroreductase family protein [Methylotenera sp.]